MGQNSAVVSSLSEQMTQNVGQRSVQTERDRQIRVALVLYGGVSLAIYENGVTRCFYDLVRCRGVFAVLCELLDASAVVDVVAGTSAGGINGLLLATALESGAEFDHLADLWGRLGDLGVLLQDPKRSADTESLLNGEYFHEQLIAAFEDLCKVGDPQYESPGEMDVFITGTDLDGHARQYLDALGNEISDKEHRVVFHLQHRPGRKSLGVPKKKSQVDTKTQAAILGTIARITASFPLGFPPIRARDLLEPVQTALNETAEVRSTDGRSFVEKRSFVDGGVLANKPFGPALRAIFYRMPDSLVDRRLFYVEPDPEPTVGTPKEEKHLPVAVGIASLTAIPGHQGIADDLEKLLEHNERIRWLTRLKEERMDTFRTNVEAVASASPTYVQTRIECAARSLVLNSDAVPSALDYPKGVKRETLLDHLRCELTERIATDLGKLDPFDVVFHLRRAFHLLYEFYNDLEHGRSRPDTQTAMRLMGRVIKVLKIILDTMAVLRDHLVAATSTTDQKAASTILDEFMRFLASDAPWWAPLHPYLEPLLDLKRFADNEHDFFKKEDLNELVKQLSTVMETARKGGLGNPEQTPAGKTILDRLAEVAYRLVEACDSKDDRFRLFNAVDQELYPIEFAGGVYELDEVVFVRISPADAQIGLSNGDPHAKVSGDELAHFSAFLRRDWRTNDILQGRLDGICQIVLSLLDDNALHRTLARRADRLTRFLTENELEKRELLTKCLTDRRQMLFDNWQALRQRWDDTFPDPARRPPNAEGWTEEVKDAARAFREQLICAGQEEAFCEDVKSVYANLYYQDIKFGRCRLRPDGTKASTNGAMIDASANEAVIEAEARRAAAQALQHLSPEQQWKAFTNMDIGLQNIVGPNGQVPNNVVGEYVTLAYLMFWGMLHRSLGQRAASFLDRKRVKLFSRTPVLFIYCWLSLVRRERTTALGLIAFTVGVLFGVIGIAWYFKAWVLCGGAGLTLVGLMSLFIWVQSASKRRDANKAHSKRRWPVEPYKYIPGRVRTATLLGVSLSSIALMIVLAQIRPPGGYMALELAAFTGGVQQVLGRWTPEAQGLAFFGLGLDYLFLVLYPLALSLLCSAAARGEYRWPLLSRWGTIIASIVLVAVPLDAIENYGLLRVLSGSVDTFWQLLAGVCAIGKFGLVMVALFYLCVASVSVLWAKLNRGAS